MKCALPSNIACRTLGRVQCASSTLAAAHVVKSADLDMFSDAWTIQVTNVIKVTKCQAQKII